MSDVFAGFLLARPSGVPVLLRRDPGVKTFRITVLWRRPIGPMHAARAMLPALLQHGTRAHANRPALARARERLFSANVGMGFSRHAEQSVLRLSADAVSASFLPGEPDQFGSVQELMLEQATRSRLLAPGLPLEVFERERAQALADARAIKEDRGRQARLSAVLQACQGEPYGVPEHGGEAAISAVAMPDPPAALRDFLQHGEMTVLLAGALPDEPERKLLPFLTSLPTSRPEPLLPPVQPPLRQARTIRETAPMQQAKVVLVLRAPVPDSPARLCALQVAMSLWGGGPHSRLFTEVREKRSLCYYASAGGDADKGLLLVQSGCGADSVAAVGEESMRQLAEIGAGRFSAAELATSIAVSQGPLRSIDDAPGARLSYTAEQFLRGFDETPEQRIASLGAVGREAVCEAASAIWLDVDYALLPEGGP